MHLIRLIGLRILFYALPIVLTAGVILWDASVENTVSKFGENSFTEWLQVIFLLLTSIIFFWSGFVDGRKRAIAFLMSGGAFVALIREFDWQFDRIYHGAWFPFAMAMLLLTLWGVYKNRSHIRDNIEAFFKQPAFGVFIAGFMTVFLFSRLFGCKVIWRALFEVDNLEPVQRWVKNACEEGVELFGYSLLFIAAMDYLIYIFGTRRTLIINK